MGAGAARALEATGSGDADNGSACEGRGSGHMASADTVTSTGRAAATTGGAAAATGRVAAATGRVAAATGRAAAATGMAGTTGTGGMSYCGVAEADGADERAVGEGITDADWDWEYGIVGGWMVDDEAAA